MLHQPARKDIEGAAIAGAANLTRRKLLGCTVAGALLPVAVGAPAGAEAMADPALRAVYRFALGDMTVTMIDDASFAFPAPAFAANQPEGSIDGFLGRFGLPTDFVNLHMQVTLVQSGDATVLIDTGMGDVTFPGNQPDNGRLLKSLAAIGVAPGDVTHVILTHGHPDHIGACALGGKPTFPNADYYMSPKELEFWTQKPGSEANFPNFMLGVGNAQLEPVRKRIKPYADGDQIVPGITAVAAPGHTLDHHAFLLESGGKSVLHLVDAAVHWLVGPEEPEWALAVEMDPVAAVATRKKLFSEAAAKHLTVIGYHFPFPGIGVVIEQGAGWRFVPLAI